jgi:opacity protein-like surface antigen
VGSALAAARGGRRGPGRARVEATVDGRVTIFVSGGSGGGLVRVSEKREETVGSQLIKSKRFAECPRSGTR